MGFRFRRSFKVAPGIRLNLSKRGLGMSVGVRGARVSLGADGKVRRTIGLPGTGVSYTDVVGSSPRSHSYDTADEVSYLPTDMKPVFTPGQGRFLDCVSGEKTYDEELERVAAEHGAQSSMETVAALMPRDRIVDVVVEGRKVGRLDKQTAPEYLERLRGEQLQWRYITVKARLELVERKWQVLLDLPS